MSFFTLERRIPSTQAIAFLRNLGTTIGAGVSLSEALALLEEDAPKQQKKMITHLRTQVEKGSNLASAMMSSPLTFPSIAVNLVKAGEQSGTLEKNLKEIVSYLTKTRDLRRSVGGAMLYPALVLSTLAIVGMGVGIYVLPAIIPLFKSLDVELPFATKILLTLADFFQRYGTHVVFGFFLGVAVFLIALNIPLFKSACQTLLLKSPYIGRFQKGAALAQISSTLATLLSSGIPLTGALPICAASTLSLPYRHLLLQAIPAIQNGSTLSGSLARSPLIPSMARGFIKLGEKTGTLSKNLQYLSGYYEEEVRYAAKNLGTTLEPILLIGVGLLVGSVALAIITPIYRVTGSIG